MSIAKLEDFVRALDAALVKMLGEAVIATYLHGSAVLGGFVHGRSDVDVLFIVDAPSDEEELREAARALSSVSANCPGRGVELSVVTADDAAHPAAPWPFLLHMTTDPADGNDRVVVGGGDPDLVMHYAVCRARGLALRGGPPEAFIGEISRRDVLTYLDRELAWAMQGNSEAYALLNACRAWHYVVTSEIVSKLDGARLAIERGGPDELIRSAVARQLGDQADRPPSTAAGAFVREIRERLRAGGS
jgi:aminoglycoside adenylyltransferase-like protein